MSRNVDGRRGYMKIILSSIIIIAVLSIFLYSCYLDERVTATVRITYTKPCWVDANTLLYAKHENRGQSNGEFYRSVIIYKFDMASLTEEEICKVEWDDLDKTQWLYGIYSVNDSIFLDFDHIVYYLVSHDSLQITNIHNIAIQNQIIRFSEQGDTIYYNNGNEIYKVDRSGNDRRLIVRTPEDEAIDFYETSAGIIVVEDPGYWPTTYLVTDSGNVTINFLDTEVAWWYELNKWELREFDLNAPRSVFCYIDEAGEEILEFTAEDSKTEEWGLCKLRLSGWETDTIRFYNEMAGKRSPFKDKFIITYAWNEESFTVIDSLNNVYLSRIEVKYEE